MKQKLLITALFVLLLIAVAACSSEAADKVPEPSLSPESTVAETVEPTSDIPEVTPSPEPTVYLGEEIANFAKQYEGYKYIYGAQSPDVGFDCSGLIWYVYRQYGYRMNRVAVQQNSNGNKVESMDDLLPGDIVLFSAGGTINHCGIYLGDDLFIHAMDKAHGVVITSLSEWASTRKLYMRRIVGSEEPVYTQEEIQILDQEEADYLEWLKTQPTPTPKPKGPEPGVTDCPSTPYVPTPTPEPTPEPTTPPEEPPAEQGSGESGEGETGENNPPEIPEELPPPEVQEVQEQPTEG